MPCREHPLFSFCHVAIGCRPIAQVPAALSGLKNCDWLFLVRHLRRIYFPAPSIDTHYNCFVQIQFGVASSFKLLDCVHLNLRSRIVLCYHCNVIHEGNAT